MDNPFLVAGGKMPWVTVGASLLLFGLMQQRQEMAEYFARVEQQRAADPQWAAHYDRYVRPNDERIARRFNRWYRTVLFGYGVMVTVILLFVLAMTAWVAYFVYLWVTY